MSASEPYLQFPICLLSYGKSVQERLSVIIDYCTVNLGQKRWSEMSPAAALEALGRLEASSKLPAGYRRQEHAHGSALLGMRTLGISYSSLDEIFQRHTNAENYIMSLQRRHGRDSLVRIKLEYFFKTRDHKGLTYREFSALCAIYSCIGNKDFAQITQARICRCAFGFRTMAVMRHEFLRRADKANPLTERQVRSTIARLHRNGFFARCTFARRITYYSHRLTDAQLRERVRARHSWSASHRAEHAAKDAAMTEAIRQIIAKAASKLRGKKSSLPRKPSV